MILQLNTGIWLCFDNLLYFSLAEEALISTHHLMLNADPKQQSISAQVSDRHSNTVNKQVSKIYYLLKMESYRFRKSE